MRIIALFLLLQGSHAALFLLLNAEHWLLEAAAALQMRINGLPY